MQPTFLVLALALLGQTVPAAKPDPVSTPGAAVPPGKLAPQTLPDDGPSVPRRRLAPLIDSPLRTRPPATVPDATPAAAPATTPLTAPAAAPATTAEQPARPTKQRRATPPEMISTALMIPAGSPIQGRPLTLLEALSRASTPPQRLQVTRAYWSLVEAVARCHYCREATDGLARLTVRPGDTSAAASAQAAAQAALGTARLAVVAAQHELAEAARLAPIDPLPLPADRPHIGTYYTRFDEMFSMQAAPGRTRLIDRTLPVRCRGIDVRADAVHAAEDALEAMVDAYRAGRADVAAVLSCQNQLALQQQALVATVCEYNDDIAEYALTVAPPQITGQALVAMLIAPVQTGPATAPQAAVPSPKLIPRPSSAVEQAGLTEPIRPVPQPAMAPVLRNQPTLAPPRKLSPTPAGQTPTLAPPRSLAPGATPGRPTLAPPRKSPADAATPNEPTPAGPPAGQTPTLAPPQGALPGSGAAGPPLVPLGGSVTDAGGHAVTPAAAAPQNQALPPAEPTPATAPQKSTLPPAEPQDPRAPAGLGEPKLPPCEPVSASGVQAPAAAPPVWWNRPGAPPQGPAPAKPATRTVQKPVLDDQGSVHPSTAALYPALAEASPAARAAQLTVALHWDRSVPHEHSDAATLADCLGYYLGTERREVIDAYWVASQQAAAYQVTAQQAELLRDLVPAAIENRRRPLGAESMLQLRAARLAADADLFRARVELDQSQFALTRRVGRPPDGNWLLPTTAPHAGSYDLKLAAQPPQLVQSWPLRRAAAMVPGLHQNLAECGTAVVRADAARAAATAAYQAGRQPVGDVLALVDDQTRQTLAFLQTLSDYNQAIADYALAVLPPNLPPEKLVQTLVLAN